MNVMRIEALEAHGHDVYEFCYDMDYPNQWNNDSVFVDSDVIQQIQTYINVVFKNFHYYGPQKVSVSEWTKIKQLCLAQDNRFDELFWKIEQWKHNDPQNSEFFWILGI